MRADTKVFGIGLRRTGTGTLGLCFDILGLGPVADFDSFLNWRWERSGRFEPLRRTAEHYRSFHDVPWSLAWRELDAAFPGSKFVLTVRADPELRARSDWNLLVVQGRRFGEPTDDFIRASVAMQQRHEQAVRQHFAERPDDLVVICWESGDGWPELCMFLGLPVPTAPLPHAHHWRTKRGVWFHVAARLGLIRVRTKVRMARGRLRTALDYARLRAGLGPPAPRVREADDEIGTTATE